MRHSVPIYLMSAKLTICLQIQQITSPPGQVFHHVESGFMLRLNRLPSALTNLFLRYPRGLLFEKRALTQVKGDIAISITLFLQCATELTRRRYVSSSLERSLGQASLVRLTQFRNPRREIQKRLPGNSIWDSPEFSSEAATVTKSTTVV